MANNTVKMPIPKKGNQPDDVYEFDKILHRTFSVINRELSRNNVMIITEYDKEMARQSISKAARRIHVQALLNLSRMLQKDWNDVTKKDIDNLVFKIMDSYANERGQETWTSFDLKKVLKIFFRWYKLGSRDYKRVGDPPETRDVILKPVRDRLSREDLVTESDLTRLLHACGENARDRAFIDVHYEAGTRPGEILNLQLKHVTFDEYGAIIKVDGKTGSRNVRLVRSVPNLANWYNVHPFRDNPNAPLWIMLKKEKYGAAMTYSAATKMLKIRSEIAQLNKQVNLKLFRHSEATRTAMFLTEAQLKKRHGWSAISRMPARYVHMVDSDVDSAMLGHYGIERKESSEKDSLPKTCHVCKKPNEPNSKVCIGCGRPLDIKTLMNLQEESKKNEEQLRLEIKEVKERLEKAEQKKEDFVKFITPFVSTGEEVTSRLYNRLRSARNNKEFEEALKPIALLALTKAAQKAIAEKMQHKQNSSKSTV